MGTRQSSGGNTAPLRRFLFEARAPSVSNFAERQTRIARGANKESDSVGRRSEFVRNCCSFPAIGPGELLQKHGIPVIADLPAWAKTCRTTNVISMRTG